MRKLSFLLTFLAAVCSLASADNIVYTTRSDFLPVTALAQTVSFSPATNYAVGAVPYSVAIGDLNGDGKPDLAVANLSSNNVSILLGTGTGAFGAATNFAAGDAPFSVAIGDLVSAPS
jgi:hypothetical protein